MVNQWQDADFSDTFMSDTPRTDAESDKLHFCLTCVHFARQLERELNEWKLAAFACGLYCADQKPESANQWRTAQVYASTRILDERDQLRAELEKVRGELGLLKSDREWIHACLLNREESLKASGEDWVKAKEDRDKWQAMAKELAQELTDNLAPEIQSPALERFSEMDKSKGQP